MGNYIYSNSTAKPDLVQVRYDDLVRERQLELASIQRGVMPLRDAIRYIKNKFQNKEYPGLSDSLRTGILRCIITKNYAVIINYIQSVYYKDNLDEYATFEKTYGSQAKDTSLLLPEKTIQDSMLSFGESVNCKVLTVTCAAEIIWMIYTCLYSSLPRKQGSGRPLFKFLASSMYNDLCQEWDRTHQLTKNVILGRLPGVFTNEDIETAMRLARIKEQNLVDARFSDTPASPASSSGSESPFSERQRILQEKLQSQKKRKKGPIPPLPNQKPINFAKRHLQLERCISVPNFKVANK